MDTKLVEQWLRMAADALRGTEQARKAFDALGATPPTADALERWWRLWFPAGEEAPAPPEPEQLREWVESWWENLGVVPKYRYMELLRRYEALKARLEEAEETVRNLRKILSEQGGSEEARSAVDRWAELTEEALKAQMEWARAWTGAGAKRSDDDT